MRVVPDGREVHVEVEGLVRELSAITVTRNEVTHARETPGTELFVVDLIELAVEQDGTVRNSGGRARGYGEVGFPPTLT